MVLPPPSTEAGRRGLDSLLAEPGRALLALDFDGTLAPIVPDPDAARGHPEVPAVLTRLAGAGVHIAVVTGRPAGTAVEYAGIADVPGLVVLGHYGLERWQDGRVTAPEVSEGVQRARREVDRVLAEAGTPDGTWVEDKGRAVAVHTRRTPDPQGTFESLREPLAALARDCGLVVEPGRYVLELRPEGADKGAALGSLVDELHPASVTFAGDDLGDLTAYDEVDRRRDAGLPGLLVCSGSTETTALAERADLVVDGPDGVVALLAALADELA
ncbi:MAG: trehalose 6-phosphate phosphatase [Actinomycetota bacterium]|nr:trehalose 6-phosphate phosphatase [Actinomycetota bacterium]